GVSPLLGPLADNGGPTRTMALQFNSPALNKIPAGSAPPVDQRGTARPFGGTSDLGAFEADRNYFLVTTTADSGAGSLRQAILDANATANLAGGPDVIQFNIPGGTAQTITPSTALPNITAPVILDGYTQPGSSPNTLTVGDNAVLEIQLDGAALGGTGVGLS